MKEFCVLIGAGASAFHSSDWKANPPLGNDLAEVLRNDEDLGGDFKEVERRIGKCNGNFEDWMGRLENVEDNLYRKVLVSLSGFF